MERLGVWDPHRPFHGLGPNVARVLLAHALDERSKPRTTPASLGDAYVEVVVPAKEGPARELFGEFGFVSREDRLRMELGEAPRTGGEPYAPRCI